MEKRFLPQKNFSEHPVECLPMVMAHSTAPMVHMEWVSEEDSDLAQCAVDQVIAKTVVQNIPH